MVVSTIPAFMKAPWLPFRASHRARKVSNYIGIAGGGEHHLGVDERSRISVEGRSFWEHGLRASPTKRDDHRGNEVPEQSGIGRIKMA